MRHHARFLIFAAAAALTSGCQTYPHRDVMLFGTQTKLAIDIARQPETQTPEFTVGYKRQEFVYLPLVVNGRDSNSCAAGSTCSETPYYAGTRQSSADAGSRDAYSVFASFGAKFGGGAANTEGGLAQFFATGIAAQELGKNTSIGNALAIQPADAQAVQTVTQASAQAIDVLSTALTASERKAINARVAIDVQSHATKIDTIVVLSRKNGSFDVATWIANVDKLPDDPWKASKDELKKLTTESDVRIDLTNFYAKLVTPLYQAVTR